MSELLNLRVFLKGRLDNAFLKGLDRPLYYMLYVSQCCSSFSDVVVAKIYQYERNSFSRSFENDFCVMLRIPPNTGWVERAYSILENVCQKRQNLFENASLKHQFFLAVLKLPVRDSFGYLKELELCK